MIENNLKEGDIIEFSQMVRTDTKRVNRSRGYDTYPIYTPMIIKAVVHIGQFKEMAHVMYYTTEQKERYPSYFFGSGRKTDTPKIITGSLDGVVRNDVKYKVVGNIND
jgi:hypothetical protein